MTGTPIPVDPHVVEDDLVFVTLQIKYRRAILNDDFMFCVGLLRDAWELHRLGHHAEAAGKLDDIRGHYLYVTGRLLPRRRNTCVTEDVPAQAASKVVRPLPAPALHGRRIDPDTGYPRLISMGGAPELHSRPHSGSGLRFARGGIVTAACVSPFILFRYYALITDHLSHVMAVMFIAIVVAGIYWLVNLFTR